MKRALSGLVILLCLSAHAEVQKKKCVGSPNEHTITFSGDGADQNFLTIRRTIDGETKDELLDDTGYLSAHILTASLLSSDQEVFLAAERSETIRLLKLRLAILKRTLKEAGIKADAGSVKAIERIETTLNRSSVVKKVMKSAWADLEQALKDESIQIEVPSRKPGTSSWGKAENIDEFTLPDLDLLNSRSMGCLHSVKELHFGDAIQASISKTAGTGNRQDAGDFFSPDTGGRQNDLSGRSQEFKQEKKKSGTR